MVVVAQGDLVDHRIDRLLLVDYKTEAVLLEFDPHISTFNNPAWRFSDGLVPAKLTEPQTTETQAQPAVGASTEPGPATNEHTEGATSGNAGEPTSNAPNSSNNPSARIRVPGKVTAAAIVSQTKPQYPPQARANNVQGDVMLHAIVNKEGKISEVQVLSGDDLLAQSALEAVRQWRYKPMLVDGEPAEVDTTIIVTFSLLD
jgi:protein TonB